MPDTKPLPVVPTDDDIFRLAGRLGGTRHFHPDADLSELEREMAAAKIARYVDRVLRDAPPLTPKQRTDLSRILRDHPGRTP